LRKYRAGGGLDFVKSPKNFSKSIPTFLLFYVTPITFYHFSNKKITTKQKISLFYTKHYYFFLHINQMCYSISSLPPVQSITKHSSMHSLVLKYSYELKLSKMKAHLVYLIVLYLLLKFQRIRFPKEFHTKIKSLFKHLNSKITFLNYHFISNIELHRYVFRHK
jgi:hypothetical protein